MNPCRAAIPVLCVALAVPAAAGSDWPHLRGPGLDGRGEAPAAFAGTPGLELGWKAKLGSSYSGVAVAAGRAVTMLADGDGDWIAAFDTETGAEIWRRRLGDRTRGVDGADDGPLSSPVIGEGRAFALAPSGRLVALGLADGAPAWERSLEQDLGAKRPYFGFTTTPLLVDGILVVQAGGSDGRAIVGLDAATGETRWAAGDEKVEYQSPVTMTLGGRRQVVAVGASRLAGLDPATGHTLWEHRWAEGDWVGSANPTFIGDDRVLVPVSGDVRAFRVRARDGAFAVEELYRSDVLGGTYAPPVYHDGHVFGFRGQVLACMNAETGERAWRSRPPGGDGLVLAGDRLVIFAAKGHVVVADADPGGYREVARIQALEGSSLTWPSFAGDRIYVRNLEQLASIRVVESKPAPVAAPTPVAGGEFARWVAAVEAADERASLVERFLAEHPEPAVVEGDLVHFLYRGAGKEVAIAGSMNDTEALEPLRRVAGTDLFYRTYRLAPGGRWEYRYHVDFERWVTDPRNPRTVPGTEGEDVYSELVTPGYPLAAHREPAEDPHGRRERFTLQSKILGYEKTIEVWLPPGYDDGNARYPLLVVNDGTAWLERGALANSLDNLVGSTVRPLVVACIDAHAQWWLEGGGSRTDEYVRMLVEEALPALGERYRLTGAAAERAVLGAAFFGASAVYAALRHPDAFGGAAVFSPYLGLGIGDEIERLIREGAAPAARFHVDWNRYDIRNVDRDWDFAEESRRLAAWLREGGKTPSGGEALDSGGWGAWRNRTDAALVALFPVGGR